MLQQTGYFPEDMPEAKVVIKPKGGDNNDKEDSD
jgi:hypothetical protein